jgi:hypothetical protein
MEPAQEAGHASETRAYVAGVRFASWWLRYYTRGVDPRFASDRQSEVSFELWEHALVADRRHWSGPHAATAVVLRSTAGMMRDWSWRRAARTEGAVLPVARVRLVSRRRRPRFWVPLQEGHTFDQTNGMIEPEKAIPYERGGGSFGAAGNAFGTQGGF